MLINQTVGASEALEAAFAVQAGDALHQLRLLPDLLEEGALELLPWADNMGEVQQVLSFAINLASALSNSAPGAVRSVVTAAQQVCVCPYVCVCGYWHVTVDAHGRSV